MAAHSIECVLGPGRDVAQQPPSLARDGEIKDVIDAGADQDARPRCDG